MAKRKPRARIAKSGMVSWSLTQHRSNDILLIKSKDLVELRHAIKRLENIYRMRIGQLTQKPMRPWYDKDDNQCWGIYLTRLDADDVKGLVEMTRTLCPSWVEEVNGYQPGDGWKGRRKNGEGGIVQEDWDASELTPQSFEWG